MAFSNNVLSLGLKSVLQWIFFSANISSDDRASTSSDDRDSTGSDDRGSMSSDDRKPTRQR